MSTTRTVRGGGRHPAHALWRGEARRHVPGDRPGHRHEHRAATPRLGAAVARLTARLLRRGWVALVVGLGAYAVMEVRVFEATYPDQATRDALVSLANDPAMRILQGLPAGTSTGALVVWDAGWMLQLIVGVWAVASASRLLRGDEEAGRIDLLLTGRMTPRAVLGVQLGVHLAACVLVGLLFGGTLAAAGTDVRGALLYGVLVGGFAATFVGVTAVLAQLLAARGRVLGVAASMLGGSVLVRMVANSSDDRAWVAWLTPLGWNDHLEPFGGDRAQVLVVPLAVCAGLVGLAVVLRGRRDAGAGLIVQHRAARSRLLWLGGPLAFAWRATLGTLLGWVAGLVAFGIFIGALLPSIVQFVEGDESYAQILAMFGVDVADILLGYVSMMGVITGLVVALYATWRVGAARAEEDSGRLEQLLVRPVQRWRWLGGHVLLAAVSTALLSLVTALATWASGRLVGADLTLPDALAASANALPAVAVFLGLAVLLLGVAPRLVVPAGASAAMVAYVVQLVGPALDWPEAVLALSPFHHLAMVPVDPFGAAAALGMLGLAVALVGAGMVAFQRRDLVGG
ncbi:hypothetical protein [Actinotalea sp.]|uniref:ABC transporter permease n=1 Tax=Actinotalea sp. TaxID=1872145 RepID=UPI002BB22C5D|nr:hypothetical protein [Actinotalea sp.]HRA51361.1 hypothetical protein [Actinotalea sp.]